jgi:hypothetical protein
MSALRPHRRGTHKALNDLALRAWFHALRPRRHTHSRGRLKRHKGGSHQKIACVLQNSIEQRIDAFMAQPQSLLPEKPRDRQVRRSFCDT